MKAIRGMCQSGPGIIVAAVISLAMVACGSDSDPVPPSDTPPVDTTSELECVVKDYPCSLSEVSIEVLERSDALGDEVLAMLEGGASAEEAAAWLREQPDMAEVQWDEQALRFRLEGGRGTWILRESAFGIPDTNGAAVSAALSAPDPGLTVSSIVGEDKEQKKALVLSPFLWEFEEWDDGGAVAAILAGTRGYENGVTFQSTPPQPDSSKVSLDSFKGWAEYQVIHVTSHGKRLCDEAGCRATISLGKLEDVLPPGPGSKAEKLKSLEELGVVHQKSEKKGYEYLALTADFFRKAYDKKVGLDDKVIYLDACQTLGSQATDLGDAIQTSNSVVFGWDEAVYSADSTETALALYQDLSEGGYPAEVAHRRLGDLRFGRPTEYSVKSPELIIKKRPDGGDLRIREVVYLLHPDSGQILTESDEVAIQGEFGDGEPDTVPYRVRVDGIEEASAADAVLHVSIDMVLADPQPLSEGTVNDQDQWTVSGVVDLPYDLDEETAMTFWAYVDLPSGGVSEHEVTATVVGDETSLLGQWVVDNDSLDVWATAFELRYVSGQIRATFRTDGTVDVVYDNWEYQVFDWDYGLSGIGGVSVDKYEEITHTINAQGTTTYEIDGNTINFGQSFESRYMEGTEVVHHIIDFTPDGYILPGDKDEVFEASSPGYRDVFTGSPDYELGTTLRLSGWKDFILHRIGSVD